MIAEPVNLEYEGKILYFSGRTCMLTPKRSLHTITGTRGDVHRGPRTIRNITPKTHESEI